MASHEGPRVTRTKTTDVIQLGGGRYRLEARLTDLSRGGNYGTGAADKPPASQRLIGKELMRGWRRAVLELSGGTRGSTHVNTLLLGLSEMQALVFFLQMNERAAFSAQTKASGEWTAAGLEIAPQLADACYSLRRGGPVLEAAETDQERPA